MPIKAIIFDLFDTLVDLRLEDFPQVEFRGHRVASSLRILHRVTLRHTDIAFETFADTLFEVDRELRETHYDRGIELPSLERFTAIVERLGIEPSELPIALTDTHMGLFRKHTRVPEHHVSLLQGLRDRVRLGLCSNFSHTETALHILEHSGMDAHLDTVVISEDHGLRKPRPEIFESVLAALDVAPSDALHVGDSLRADVGGASELGMRTAWITRRIEDPEQALADHAGPSPDFRIADLAELPRVLEDLERDPGRDLGRATPQAYPRR